MDTVDRRRGEEWLKNLDEALAGRSVDYLVVSHMEPDHAQQSLYLRAVFAHNIKVITPCLTRPVLFRVQSAELSESICGKENLLRTLIRHHNLRPVNHRSHDKSQGKYGAQVQALLKKAAGLDIRMICPLHGPILKENLAFSHHQRPLR